MNASFENQHPRSVSGAFTEKTQTAPEVAVADSAWTTVGSYPVSIAGFPDVSNYRFTATAISHDGAGRQAMFFSAMEMEKVLEPVNKLAEGSDCPETIRRVGDHFYLFVGAESEMLPELSIGGDKFYSLPDGSDTELELTAGEWFDENGTGHNLTEVITDRAVGDTFDRRWTTRRDDGMYITRNVTWFVEQYDDSEDDFDDDTDRTITYSVFCRTEDFEAESFDGDKETIEDIGNEDHLETDRVFETIEAAETFARSRANGAETYFHISGWDGHKK